MKTSKNNIKYLNNQKKRVQHRKAAKIKREEMKKGMNKQML